MHNTPCKEVQELVLALANEIKLLKMRTNELLGEKAQCRDILVQYGISERDPQTGEKRSLLEMCKQVEHKLDEKWQAGVDQARDSLLS